MTRDIVATSLEVKTLAPGIEGIERAPLSSGVFLKYTDVTLDVSAQPAIRRVVSSVAPPLINVTAAPVRREWVENSEGFNPFAVAASLTAVDIIDRVRTFLLPSKYREKKGSVDLIPDDS